MINRYALDMLLLNNPPKDSEYIEEFLDRWHGMSPQALRSAVNSSDDRDCLFALFSLPDADPSLAREELPRFLEDSRPPQRWASALGLGHLRDKRALSSLHRMLTEFLPPEERPSGMERWYFRGWRFEIPQLLADWGEASSASPMRNSLIKVIGLENAEIGLQQVSVGEWDVDTLRRYEDVMVFNLGRLGVWGALANIAAPATRIETWCVHLVMGHLFHRHDVKGLLRWSRMPELRFDVQTLLEHVFGFDESARTRALTEYEGRMAFTLSELHRKKQASGTSPTSKL